MFQGLFHNKNIQNNFWGYKIAQTLTNKQKLTCEHADHNLYKLLFSDTKINKLFHVETIITLNKMICTPQSRIYLFLSQQFLQQ